MQGEGHQRWFNVHVYISSTCIEGFKYYLTEIFTIMRYDVAHMNHLCRSLKSEENTFLSDMSTYIEGLLLVYDLFNIVRLTVMFKI